ncbi:MAG: vWA domain-containing protein [Ardenticatenales bacterium]
MPTRTAAATSIALAAFLAAVALAPPHPVAPARAADRPTSSVPSPTPRGTQVARPCIVVADRRVEPETVLLGETVDVTMTVLALCASTILPLHVVLVIDGSDAMAGGLGRDVQESAAALVDDLRLSEASYIRVAVVGFDDRVRVKCALSNDARGIKRCIERIGERGNARLETGLMEAGRQLQLGRDDYTDPANIRQVVVVYTGRPTGGCLKASRAVGRLKDDGDLVITVGIGDAFDEPCVRDLATSPRYYFPWRERTDVVRVFESIRKQFQNIIVKTLTIADRLPAAFEILTDTARPEPDLVDVADGRIRWTQTHIPKDGVTVTYRARTLAPGYQPSTLGAGGTFSDNRNHPDTFAFPASWITVLGTQPGT